MRLTVFTADRDLAFALEQAPLPAPAAGRLERFEVEPPQRVPGALESFWELAVDIGLISAPVGVVCNLIASWLYDAFKHRAKPPGGAAASGPPVEVKLVIHVSGDPVELWLKLCEIKDMAAALAQVFPHDDPGH